MMVSSPSAVPKSVRSRAWAFGFIAALYLTWIFAWLIDLALESTVSWITSDFGSFVYWTTMKVLIWVVPATFVMHQIGLRVSEVMAPARWRSILLWGLGAGIILAAINIIPHAFVKQPLFAPQLSWALVNAVVIAPIVEEYTFRGVIFVALKQRYRFIMANSLTALFFLGAHLPGWYFQGKLNSQLMAPIGGAFSIFLLGWIFGFVRERSQSVLGGTLAHIINNFSSM
jgi:uncharacterized protein